MRTYPCLRALLVRCGWLRTTALFLAFTVVGRAALAPSPTGPVVELDRFVVTDQRDLPPPESWRYASIPGFEVLTNASDRATQRLLRDFDEFRQALGYIWPLPPGAMPNTSLILVGEGSQFDRLRPAAVGSAETNTASAFLRQHNRAAIVIDLQATTLDVLNTTDTATDSAMGTDSGLVSVEHDKALYREYVRFLLSRSEPRLPAWFEEGLSQIIMRMTIYQGRVIDYAKLEDANTVSISAANTAVINAAAAADDPDSPQLAGAPAEDRDFPAALRRRALVPLDRFFAVKHGSPEATNVLGNNIWAKQAYAFVHLGLYGYRGKYQKPFQTFLARASREPVTEAMFRECWGMSYQEMLMLLRSYADLPVYDAQQIRAKKDSPNLIVRPAPVAFREATQAEIGRIKGDTMVLAGRRNEARTSFLAPFIRGERDPNLLAALAVYEQADNGDPVRIRQLLEAAYAGKTTRADALLALARLRSTDALANPAGPEGRLSAEQVRSIVDPLLAARRQPPSELAVYELLADTWARSAAPITTEDAIPVIQGAMLFPGRLRLVYQCIFFANEIGDVASAHALADHGIRYAPDAAGKKRFEDAKAALPPRPAAPASAAAPRTE